MEQPEHVLALGLWNLKRHSYRFWQQHPLPHTRNSKPLLCNCSILTALGGELDLQTLNDSVPMEIQSVSMKVCSMITLLI
jgi:hypothetical protein